MSNNDDNALTVAVTTTIPAFAATDDTAAVALQSSMNIILNHVDQKTPSFKARRSSVAQDLAAIALMEDHVYGISRCS